MNHPNRLLGPTVGSRNLRIFRKPHPDLNGVQAMGRDEAKFMGKSWENMINYGEIIGKMWGYPL